MTVVGWKMGGHNPESAPGLPEKHRCMRLAVETDPARMPRIFQLTLSTKVWPDRAPIEILTPAQFKPRIDTLVFGHCR